MMLDARDTVYISQQLSMMENAVLFNQLVVDKQHFVILFFFVFMTTGVPLDGQKQSYSAMNVKKQFMAHCWLQWIQ